LASWASTSSYEPSEYSAIPIEKYAITRRRQHPMALLGPTRLSDHVVDQRRRERRRQHPHLHQVRQPAIRLRLLRTSRGIHRTQRCSPS
jgi:hypothetical protein